MQQFSILTHTYIHTYSQQYLRESACAVLWNKLKKSSNDSINEMLSQISQKSGSRKILSSSLSHCIHLLQLFLRLVTFLVSHILFFSFFSFGKKKKKWRTSDGTHANSTHNGPLSNWDLNLGPSCYVTVQPTYALWYHTPIFCIVERWVLVICSLDL